MGKKKKNPKSEPAVDSRDKETTETKGPASASSHRGGNRNNQSKKNNSRGNSRRGKNKVNKDEDIVQTSTSATALGELATRQIGFTSKSYRQSISREHDAFPLLIHGCGVFDSLFAFAYHTYDADDGIAPLSSGLWKSKDDPGNVLTEDKKTSHLFSVSKATINRNGLEGKTSMSRALRNEAWPTLSTLFESGIRANVNINFSQWIIVIARVHYLYSTLMTWNQLAALWESTRDQGDDISRALSRICVDFGIVKSANRAKLKVLNDVIQSLPVLPNIVNESRRMLTAYINPLNPSTMIIPGYGKHFLFNSHMDKSSFVNSLKELDDVVEGLFKEYTDEMAFMSTFMPDTVRSTNATMTGEVTVDPIKAVGFFNTDFWAKDWSTTGTYDQPLVHMEELDLGYRMTYPRPDNPSKDEIPLGRANYTGKPKHTLNYDISHGSSPFFHTMFDEPTFLEFMSSTVWLANNLTLADQFMLFTPHFMRNLWVFDEQNDIDHDDLSTMLVKISKDSVLTDPSNRIATTAYNFWRRVGCKWLTRVGNTNSTWVAGLKESTLDLTNFDELIQAFVYEMAHVNAYTNLAVSQSGKFNAPVSDVIKGAIQ